MKFSQAIEAYNKAIDNEVNISSNNKIELYDSTVQEAIAKKMISALGYIDFLLDRDNQAAIDYYVLYIEGVIAQGKGNFVQGINKMFSNNRYYSDGYSYGKV